MFATENVHHEEPQMDQKDAIILLILATVLVSWMAEVLVHSVESAAEQYHLPYIFIGVIITNIPSTYILKYITLCGSILMHCNVTI